MKTNTILLTSSFLLLTFSFLGCDYLDSRAVDRERADSIYKSAMEEYAAGRVDKAIAGLERVVRATPDKASARFQLACLLQDVKKDYLGAICNYREFLAQDKSGDKASLAKERIDQCERALAPALIRKFNIGDHESLTSQNAALGEKVAALEKTNKDLEKRLERAMARAEESASETERMRKMLMGEVAEDAAHPVIKTEEALLDDEENAKTTDRIQLSQDVKNLVVDEKTENPNTPFKVTEKKPKPVEKVNTELPHEPRPPVYVVQEGDTLYKLAVRFYGMRGAWVRIREANKAVVSTDGRIKVGQKLVLP